MTINFRVDVVISYALAIVMILAVILCIWLSIKIKRTFRAIKLREDIMDKKRVEMNKIIKDIKGIDTFKFTNEHRA